MKRHKICKILLQIMEIHLELPIMPKTETEF